MGIELKCLECKKSFIIKPSYYRKNVRRCSLKCAYKARKGRLKTEEHKKKIALAHIGMKGTPHTEKARMEMSIARKGKYPLRGKTLKEMQIIREKISKSQFGRVYPHRQGKNSHLWRGGVSSRNHLERSSSKYRIWRKSVFERDNYTCQICGIRGGVLQADHIMPFALYIDLRYKLSNGRTLCVTCHKATDSYMNRGRWQVKRSKENV